MARCIARPTTISPQDTEGDVPHRVLDGRCGPRRRRGCCRVCFCHLTSNVNLSCSKMARSGCMFTSPPTALAGARLGLSGQQPFHDDHVAPDAVELAVSLVDADFAETQGAEQGAAGRVFGEDARDE